MFKKVLSFSLVLLLCFLMVACGGDNSSEPTASTESTGSTTSTQNASGEATLTITVKEKEVTKFKSDRPYPSKKAAL